MIKITKITAPMMRSWVKSLDLISSFTLSNSAKSLFSETENTKKNVSNISYYFPTYCEQCVRLAGVVTHINAHIGKDQQTPKDFFR